MQEKGVDPFEGETCSTYDMVVLYSTLLHQDMSLEESKVMTMLSK